MANRFTEEARKALTLSPVMEGREKIETDEIIGRILTVDEFDFVTIPDREDPDEEVTYACVHFAELPDNFYNGGALLMKLCTVWAAGFDDVEEASRTLKAEGGVRLKFKKGKTSSGRQLTTISVMD